MPATLYRGCVACACDSTAKKKGYCSIKPVRLKQTSESAECEPSPEIALKGAPSAVSLANIMLLNALPLPSPGAGVEAITVELEAIFYKAAQQNTFMLCCVSSAIQSHGGEGASQSSLETSVSGVK